MSSHMPLKYVNKHINLVDSYSIWLKKKKKTYEKLYILTMFP